MLETPLYGRFLGENKYLIFAPAQEYLLLVGACILGGAGCAVWGLFQDSFYFICLGVAVCMAGIAGALSLQWISFNLRERVYTRRQGPGFFPKTTRGSFNDLEAIFLLSEARMMLVGQVTYRLLLQWRNGKEPSMVLTQSYASVTPGQMLNQNAGPLYHLGAKAAQLIGIPIVDHAHVSTPNPVSMIR